MKKSLVLLLLSFSLAQIFAQGITYDHAKRKAKDLFDEGNNAYAFAKVTTAETALNEAIKEEPRFVDAYWVLGLVELEYTEKYKEAALAFEKVKQLKSDFSPKLDYNIGMAYFYAGDYAKAKAALTEAKTKGTTSQVDQNSIDNLIKSCDYAVEAVKSPRKFQPMSLGDGVNTPDDEYMPTVTADERYIYFTRLEHMGRAADENIWMSEQLNSKWGPAALVDRPISTDEYIEGATCISQSGKYLFFTSSRRPDSEGDCDIYFTKRLGDTWDRPNHMNIRINKPGKDTQPCISADGRSLFFVSNRPGGKGSLDIWVSYLQDDYSWSEPQNLGSEINTQFNEERPFIHPDGKTLYFSSDGHPGFGKLDFFVSRKDVNGHWSKPENLGYPINSNGDELGIAIAADGKTAYFASERVGGAGGLDLYKFEMDAVNKPEYVTYFKGKVFDADTKAPLKANVQIFDVENSKLYTTSSSDQLTGECLLTLPSGKNYACQISKEGYLFYSANFSLKDRQDGQPYVMEIGLKKVKIGEAVILNNVFFESNKFELKEESKTELTTLQDMLTKNPNLKIEIGGHTDNSGLLKDNQMLSENRAKAVFDYLILKGVSAERLSYKGYAATKPIADNNTNEGKAKNRRTEFVVTGM